MCWINTESAWGTTQHPVYLNRMNILQFWGILSAVWWIRWTHLNKGKWSPSTLLHPSRPAPPSPVVSQSAGAGQGWTRLGYTQMGSSWVQLCWSPGGEERVWDEQMNRCSGVSVNIACWYSGSVYSVHFVLQSLFVTVALLSPGLFTLSLCYQGWLGLGWACRFSNSHRQ